ncbi:MAG: efflux RND transporter periplasmic adaptor subunit [Verrucomicrobiae bacterium]|nr:efflux RND transporter periplasmic adaptor subunit [Verrucomicrobiae bacterium]
MVQLWVAIFVINWSGCVRENSERWVSGTIETDEARLASRYGGRVEKIFVVEGAPLTNGQVIVELEAGELKARREQAAAFLAELEAGPRQHEIDAAKAEWEAITAELELARIERHRAEELIAGRAISEADVDRAIARERALEKNAAAARKKYELLLAGTRPEQIAQARARLAELDAQLAEARVTAPGNCVLEVLSVRKGDVLPPNKEVATVLFPDSTYARVYVPEPWLGHIRPGIRAKARVDAYPGREFEGIVEFVGRVAEFTPRNVQTVEERVKQVFAVKVRLPNRSGELRAGMAVDVLFPVDEAR